MRKVTISGLGGRVSALALAIWMLTGTAQAQSAPPATPSADKRKAADDALLGDIVVTARKREESAQTVPIAISAFSAEAIQARGVTQIDQIANFTPNLTYQNNAGFGGGTNVAAIYIRGIGQFDFLGSIEPGVGLYVDGVYIARSVGAILDLVDVERVEILRGPQGTLFGRNTIGGAVSITTQKPDDKFGGRASFLYGDDDRAEVKGSVNVPLGDKAALKLSAAYFNRDGYVTRISDNRKLGNKDTFTMRAALHFKPADNFTADLAFDYTRDKSNGVPAVLKGYKYTSVFFNPNGRTLLPPSFALTGGSPFTITNCPNGTPARAAGNGFEGCAGSAIPGVPVAALLPPGTDPNTIFYQLNVQDRPPNGAPAGTPASAAFAGPLDAPTDNFALLWNYLQSYAPGATPGTCLSAPFQPYSGSASGANCVGPQWYESTLGKNRVASDYNDFSRSRIWGISLNLAYDLGPVELVSISAYRKLTADFGRDQDLTPFPIGVTIDNTKQWQFSQEVQVKGKAFDDRLNWILGGYFFKEKVDNLNDVIFTPIRVRSGGVIDNKSYAVFGQGTFKVTDALSLTAGLRWTQDDKKFNSDPYQYIQQSFVGPAIAYGFDACPNNTLTGCTTNPAIPAGFGPLTVYQDRITTLKTNRATPYVNLSYQWTPEAMTYVSFSQGFKSGGFTQRVFPPVPRVPSVNPEKATVYEAGFKTQWLERRLRLNGAVYYTDYKDLQVQGFTLATGVAPVYTNAASARIAGFELDMAASPGDGWFFEAALGYTGDKYKNVAPTLIGLDKTKRFERVSRWSATAAVQKTFDVAGFGSIRPRFDWAYRSKFYNDASNIEQISQPGYSIFNGSLAWTSENDAFSIIGSVNNIGDKDYILSAIWNANIGAYQVTPARGREWSIRAEVKF